MTQRTRLSSGKHLRKHPEAGLRFDAGAPMTGSIPCDVCGAKWCNGCNEDACLECGCPVKSDCTICRDCSRGHELAAAYEVYKRTERPKPRWIVMEPTSVSSRAVADFFGGPRNIIVRAVDVPIPEEIETLRRYFAL